MIRALKVLLIVTAVFHISVGLALTITPEQWASLAGIAQISVYERWLMGLFGISLISGGVFIAAARRDPLQHIYWVKFAILRSILTVVFGIYLLVQDYVTFSQVGPIIVLDAIFAAAFLILYPWRAARANQ